MYKSMVREEGKSWMQIKVVFLFSSCAASFGVWQGRKEVLLSNKQQNWVMRN